MVLLFASTREKAFEWLADDPFLSEKKRKKKKKKNMTHTHWQISNNKTEQQQQQNMKKKSLKTWPNGPSFLREYREKDQLNSKNIIIIKTTKQNKTKKK